ncbi:MAG: cell division protein [Alphaproteobacteria bacterium]|nr:MAG: cell division protein [Alphaproteobacteria bacterium]
MSMWGRTLQFLPKQNQREGLLPWVIGVMLFLCALSLTSALALGRGLERWSAGLTSNLSVQIVVDDPMVRKAQTEDALRLLRATPGVAEASVMADADVIALLSPWLGEIPTDTGLPLPTLIEVKLTAPDAVNIKGLGERLMATASGARLDDHQAWMTQILNLAAVVRLLLAGIVVMVVLCTVAIVIFGCRAGLATHRESIEIMHLMGAEDRTISQAFDERYLAHGLKGGLFGVLMAGLTLYILIRLADDMGQGLIQASLPAASSLAWLALLPVLSGVVTMLTARITVRRALLDLM